MLAAISLSVRGLPCGPPNKIIGGSHVQTRQDRGHDADHSFAAFVHDWSMILYSLYIRYRALGPMQRNKINRAKVLAALNTTCPSCGFSISPAEVVRIDFERMRCPKCGAIFEPGKCGKRIRMGQEHVGVSVRD